VASPRKYYKLCFFLVFRIGATFPKVASKQPLSARSKVKPPIIAATLGDAFGQARARDPGFHPATRKSARRGDPGFGAFCSSLLMLSYLVRPRMWRGVCLGLNRRPCTGCASSRHSTVKSMDDFPQMQGCASEGCSMMPYFAEQGGNFSPTLPDLLPLALSEAAALMLGSLVRSRLCHPAPCGGTPAEVPNTGPKP
jgi:hypothetical protein